MAEGKKKHPESAHLKGKEKIMRHFLINLSVFYYVIFDVSRPFNCQISFTYFTNNNKSIRETKIHGFKSNNHVTAVTMATGYFLNYPSVK